VRRIIGRLSPAAGGSFFGFTFNSNQTCSRGFIKMNLNSDSYGVGNSTELDPVLDALAEINVQLRKILQASKSVVMKLEMSSRPASPIEELELETKNQSILVNMIRTGEAVGFMNQEISDLLRRGRNSELVDRNASNASNTSNTAQLKLVPSRSPSARER
jgi:hypothetical protein